MSVKALLAEGLHNGFAGSTQTDKLSKGELVKCN